VYLVFSGNAFLGTLIGLSVFVEVWTRKIIFP